MDTLTNFFMSATAMRRVTWLLLGGLLLLYAGWITYVILADRPLDAYVYMIAAETIARGEDPYAITDPQWDATAAQLGITNYTRPYRYPPHTALLFLPLLELPPQAAVLIWVTLNALGMIAGAWFLGGLYPQPYSRPLSLLLMLGMAPPLATLLAGQVNGLLYLTTALGLVWLVQAHRVRAGLMLAVGTVLKVLPFALILYLFWRKQWRTATVAIVILVVLILLGVPLTGVDGTVSYFQHGVARTEPGSLFDSPTTQTITAFLGRTFPGANVNQLLWIGRLLSLLMIVATVAICIPVGDFKDYLICEYALIVAALQTIAPFTWYHQLVMIQIPLFIVSMMLLKRRQMALLAVILLGYLLFNIHGLFWRQITDMLGNGWWMSMPLILVLILWGYLAIDIVLAKRRLVG